MDVLCQAKSGMGKTAVFVLATLQELDIDEAKSSDDVLVLVLAHTRELAYQIQNEYRRFAKYMPGIRTAVFFGGEPYAKNLETLKTVKPQVVVGTPGRILQLVKENNLKLGKVKHFILDECDQVLEKTGTRPASQQRPAGETWRRRCRRWRHAGLPRPVPTALTRARQCHRGRGHRLLLRSLDNPAAIDAPARGQTCARTSRTSSATRPTKSR